MGQAELTATVSGLLALVLVAAPAHAAEQRLLASDGAGGDYFGEDVAISGNHIIVGAPYDDDNGGSSGAAYIFRLEDGDWTEHQKLTASDGQAADWFGEVVTIDGDFAAVGATREDQGGTSAGAVYVFHNVSGTWTQQPKIISGDIQSYDHFGWALAISGDTLVVGAPDEDEGGGQAGAAYVFVHAGGVWTQQAKLLAGDADGGDGFGWGVAVWGDTVVVGAPGNDDACDPPFSLCESGSAYVFTRSGTSWSQTAKLRASDDEEGDYFGRGVAVDGSQALVGAYKDDDQWTNEGAVYVYSASGWGEIQKLTAGDGDTEDLFGEVLAISGDHTVIGAYWDDDAGTNAGAVYTFGRGASWTELGKKTAYDGFADDEYGEAVDLDGTWAVIGCHYYDFGLGAAYAYQMGDLDPTWIFGDGFESGSAGAWSAVAN